MQKSGLYIVSFAGKERVTQLCRTGLQRLEQSYKAAYAPRRKPLKMKNSRARGSYLHHEVGADFDYCCFAESMAERHLCTSGVESPTGIYLCCAAEVGIICGELKSFCDEIMGTFCCRANLSAGFIEWVWSQWIQNVNCWGSDT